MPSCRLYPLGAALQQEELEQADFALRMSKIMCRVAEGKNKACSTEVAVFQALHLVNRQGEVRSWADHLQEGRNLAKDMPKSNFKLAMASKLVSKKLWPPFGRFFLGTTPAPVRGLHVVRAATRPVANFACP